MTRLSLPVFILATLASSAAATAAREDRSHSLRHTEQSVVVLSDSDATAKSQADEMLVDNMGSLLQDEAEVMDPKNPKAALQRQLVALIWLERVLDQNLNNMDTEAYRKKIEKSKTGLEKDSTPATADMLGKMRTEMHEFSVPFFRDAVKDELADIKARQKVLLDKIIAIDAGEPVEVVQESAELKKDEKTTPVTEKKDKKPELTAEQKAKKATDKAKADRQSNMMIFLMSLLGATLVLIVLGIAIKVHTHVPARAMGS